MFTEMRRFLMWLDKRWPPERNELSVLSSSDLEDYGKHLLARFPNNRSQRESSRGGVRLLWRWRLQMGEHALRFEPLHLDGWRESSSTGRGENKTDRLPEEVLGPLLVWALRFIDDFAPDILEADREWRASREKRVGRYLERSAVGPSLQAILDEYVAAGRPLPGWRGQPSLTHFSRLLGCRHDAVRPHHAALAAAAAVVGVTEGAFLDGSVQGRLDGEPWVDSIATNHESANSLARLSRILHASCYVVIAFLSGMRESEVKHIKRDCIEIKYDEDGRPYRWKLSSLAFKGEDEVEGVPATWTVCATVVRAVEMLEKLQPKTCDYLFTGLLHGNGAKKSSNEVEGNRATNAHLNDLVAFVNQLCADRGRSDIIADSAGRPFKLKTSYFRRTLAWHIARRPGGLIALAIQYGHMRTVLDARTSSGYGSRSRGGIHGVLDVETALAAANTAARLRDQAAAGEKISGPAARRALTAAAHTPKFEGRIVPAKFAKKAASFLARDGIVLFDNPGAMLICAFKRDNALCEPDPDATAPRQYDCRPGCGNTVRTDTHARLLRERADELDQLAASAPGPVSRRLKASANRFRTMADTHDTIAQSAKALT
ncbi:integrase [Streptomyces sp. NBC_01456]|uniref:integrase n=1 Tax=unclassified Streptomyces TaxID=2593676 RepID=UPI002E339623|nr:MULTISPECIES: integrase [unclassified Streptomyces]